MYIRYLVERVNCVPDLENSFKDLTTVKLLTKNSDKNLLVSPAYFPYDGIESPSSREVQDLIKCQPSMSAFGGRIRYVFGTLISGRKISAKQL